MLPVSQSPLPGFSRLHSENARDPVTWADACLTAGLWASKNNLLFALLVAAVLLQFDTNPGLRSFSRSDDRCRPLSGNTGTLQNGHSPHFPSPMTARSKTGRQDDTEAVGVAASDMQTSLPRSIERGLSDQVVWSTNCMGPRNV